MGLKEGFSDKFSKNFVTKREKLFDDEKFEKWKNLLDSQCFSPELCMLYACRTFIVISL